MNDSNVSNCSQVTEAHLAAVTGTLTVEGLTSLAAGDFAGLSGITVLTLRRQRHRDPARGPVRRARIAHRRWSGPVGLTHLPKDILPGSRQAHRSQPERQPARRRRLCRTASSSR